MTPTLAALFVKLLNTPEPGETLYEQVCRISDSANMPKMLESQNAVNASDSK